MLGARRMTSNKLHTDNPQF